MRRRYRLILNLLAIALCVGAVWFPVNAAEGTNPTSDIARQLVALGWEHPPSPVRQPVVVYSLRFVQIDTETSIDYALTVGAASRPHETQGWEIRVDNDTLQWIAAPSSRNHVSGERTARNIKTAQTAWLITVGERPVSLALREERVTAPANRLRELRMTLTPQTIDAESQRVLTHIVFDHTLPDGSHGTVDTAIWTERYETPPIALLTYQDTDSSETKRHVAICLQSTVVPPDRLPSELRLLPIGDVRAFGTLFPEADVSPSPPHSLISLGLHLDEHEDIGLDTGAAVHTEAGNRILFDISGNSVRTATRIGLDVRLVEQLFLAMRFESDPALAYPQSIRIGLFEQTRMGRLEASASFLPVLYSPNHRTLVTRPAVELGLRYVGESWDVFVEAAYTGELESTLGASLYGPSRREGVRFTWTQTTSGHIRLGFHLIATTW